MVTHSHSELPKVSSVSLNEFRKPVLPDLDLLVGALVEHGRHFRQLTRENGEASLKMAKYAFDFMEYIDILIDEAVSGEDFMEAMKSLAEVAVENKISASVSKGAFCNILVELKNISSQVVEFTVDLGDQKDVEDALEQDAQVLRKNQATTTWAAVGTGIGTGVAIVAAPFTGGASLAVIGALGVSSAGAMIGTTISSIINGEKAKLSEDELRRLQINRINARIECITEKLKLITVELDLLDQFWAEQLNVTTEIMEKYKPVFETTIFGISRMKGTMVKKQWNDIKNQFHLYKTLILQDNF
ncbi:hypothetical protein G9A89_002144 [Geosiphon pyriformis]|nr:hypothetical protein G9A89_002144 [Geosiphon pyriformis]